MKKTYLIYGIIALVIIAAVVTISILSKKSEPPQEEPLVEQILPPHFEFEGQIYFISAENVDFANKNADSCNDSPNPSEQKECKLFMLSKLGSIEKCQSAELSDQEKDLCYGMFAREYSAAPFCQKIIDENKKNECLDLVKMLNGFI